MSTPARAGSTASRSSSPVTSTSAPQTGGECDEVVVVGISRDARRIGRVGEHECLSREVAEEQLSVFGRHAVSDPRSRQHVGDFRQ